jgi:hypothetical protein
MKHHQRGHGSYDFIAWAIALVVAGGVGVIAFILWLAWRWLK